MPLSKIFEPCRGVQVGLWQMTEGIDQFPKPKGVNISFRSDKRLKEELCVYALLTAMTGNDHLVIDHEPSGKPWLDGWSVSVSHTRGWVAIILSTDFQVGIDVEYTSDRVSKVVDRFVREDEQRETLSQQLINWSAKETVYKLFSEQKLDYFDMRLHDLPSEIDTVLDRDAHVVSGGIADSVLVDVLKTNGVATVHYELTPDYVLTYSFYSN